MKGRTLMRNRTNAQSMVEFAMISPLLILLLLGVFEGARLAYAYNTINHAAQEAGRTAVLSRTESITAVRLRAVEAADPLTVSADLVTVEVNGGSKAFGDRTMGDRMRVSVDYTFVPVTNFLFGGETGLTLTGETELMVE